MTPEEVVRFAEAQAQIAAEGGGIAALTRHAATATAAAIVLEDPEGRRLAAAGEPPDPPAAATVELPVRAGARDLAVVRAYGSPHDRPALRLLAAALALELARNGRAAPPSDAFWQRLAEGTFRDLDAARDEAAAAGVTLAGGYLAIALELEQPEPGGAPIRRLRALAADAFSAGFGAFDRGNGLAVLLPVERSLDASNGRTAAALLPKAAAKRQPPLHLAGGIGTVVPPSEVRRSLEQASAALSIGRRIHGNGKVCAYDELGAYPLLYEGGGVERLRAFAQRTLAPLRAYDEKHQTELLRTLRLYFEVGQNVKTAAATLYVHRHTVFYRLRQIAEICNISWESPMDQLTLRTAVAIDALHS